MRTVTAAVLAAALLTLAGCGGSSAEPEDKPDASAPESTVEAATGDTINGSGYTYVAPEGWGDPPQDIPGFDPDTLVVDLDDKDGFADNLNTLLDPSIPASISLDKLEGALKKNLTKFGVTGVTVEDRLNVGGEPAVHLSGEWPLAGGYRSESYAVTDGSKWFAVTFSFSKSVSEADRVDLAESVLTTWKWTGGKVAQ